MDHRRRMHLGAENQQRWLQLEGVLNTNPSHVLDKC